MNSNTGTAKNEVDDVSKRIKNNKKELEELKAGLEQLINSNIKKPGAHSIKLNKTEQNVAKDKGKKENERPTKKVEHHSRERDVTQPTSSIFLRTNKTAIQKESKNKTDIVEQECPKKVRTYDKTEARDYIKRQKEKRYEEQKANLKERQNTEDVKKQKLKELHEKSKMLVAKSITLKRERSKSREPASNLLPIKTGERARSQSRDRLYPSQLTKNTEGSSSKNFKQLELGSNSHQLKSSESNLNLKTTQKVKSPNVPVNNLTCQTKNKSKPIIRNQHNSNITTRKRNLSETSVSNIDDNPPSVKNLIKIFDNESKKAEIKSEPQEKSSDNPTVVSLKINTNNKSQKGESSIKSVTSRRERNKVEEELNKEKNNILKNKKSDNAIMTETCEKLTKDTQTATSDRDKNLPTWLQPTYTSDPYNFINTVKKKLQLVTNSTYNKRDISTPQNSATLKSPNSKTPENNPKTKEEIMELIQNSIKNTKHSEIKSFNSHKNLELDFMSLDNLELPTENKLKKTDPSLRSITSDTSESDTSKNIPELSSESLSSLKRNAVSVNKSKINGLDVPKLHLNFHSDKLNKLQLEKPNLDTFSIQKENGTLSEIFTATSSHGSRSQKTERTNKKSSYSTDFDLSDVNTKLTTPKSHLTIRSSTHVKPKNPSYSIHSNHSDIPQTNNSSLHSNITIRSNTSIEDISQISTAKSSKHSKNNDESINSMINANKNKDNYHVDGEFLKPNSNNENFEEQSFTNSVYSSTHISTSINSTSDIKEDLSRNTQNEVEVLKAPSVSLQIPGKKVNQNNNLNQITQNISVIRGNNELQNPNNEIRLKFEAEVHLLNDFNASLQQFMAVEKAYEDLKHKNDNTTVTKILQNRDTQTSIITRSLNDKTASISDDRHTSVNEISSINYSRGSEIIEELNGNDVKNKKTNKLLNNSIINNSTLNDISILKTFDNSLLASVFEFPDINDTLNTSNDSYMIMSTSEMEHVTNENNLVGYSMRMLEQLIKDEDARIENLTTIIKIREKALLDRTRSELACLEVIRKELIETGKLSKASAIKKKQRGIILKHQQERNEMQRLKQTQKAASKARKTILKQQSNQIKAQLSTNNMLSKMKVTTPRRKRISGPMRVIQSHSESIVSETSISRKNSSTADDILSVTSHSHSVVSRICENVDPVSDMDDVSLKKINLDNTASNLQLSNIKSNLLMRESDLRKRRKTAEELLKWHQKLLDEEKKIQELESATKEVINQTPSNLSVSNKLREKYYEFTGAQLNKLWKNMTGREEQQFKQHKIFKMSQTELERFCKKGQDYSKKLKSSDNYKSDKISEVSSIKLDEIIPDIQSSISTNVQSEVEKSINTQSDIKTYTSDFDTDSVKEISEATKSEKTAISSISELMENFNKINKDISSLSEKSLPAVSSITNQPYENASINIHNVHFSPTQETAKIEELDTVNDVQSLSENNILSYKSNNNISTIEENLHQIKSVSDSEEQVISLIEKSSNKESVIDLNEVKFLIENVQKSNNNSVLEDTLKSVSISADKITSVDEINTPTREVKSSIYSDIEPQTNISIRLSEETIKSDDTVSQASKDKIISATEKEESLLPENIESASTNKSITIEEEQKPLSEEISEASRTSHKTSPSKVSLIISSDLKHNTSDSKIISQEICEEQATEDTKSISESIKPVEEMKNNNTENTLNEIIGTSNNVESSKSVTPVLTIESNNSDTKVTESENIKNSKNKLSLNKSNTSVTPTNIFDSLGEIINSRKKVKKRVNLFDTAAFNLNIEDQSVIVPENIEVVNKNTETITSNGSATISSGEITEEENKENISVNNLHSTSEKEVKSTETKEVDETEEESVSDRSDSVITTISTPKSKEIKSSPNSNTNNNSNEISEKTIDDEGSNSEVIPSHNSLSKSEEKSTINDYSAFLKESLQTSNKTESTGSELHSEKSEKSIKNSIADTDNSVKTDIENSSSEKLTKPEHVDVKKRVSEILADASPVSRGDKSPRVQDLYCTTYDLISPTNSPELGSPEKLSVDKIFDSEAEELLRKQLAIEKEIKQLEQQQMKEQLPYLYIREIPDKPPPPYTPPSSTQASNACLLPTSVELIHDVATYASNILHKAYKANNLANVRLTERNFKLVSKRQISSQSCEFLFDFCRETAINHYKQFEEEKGPSWLKVSKKQQFSVKKPLDATGLEKHLNKKLKELCGLQKSELKESAIIKWSRKKHDHVDEVLVLESQAEESEWINYDKDELIVKDEVANDIMNMLLSETADIFKQLLSKKT